ncbi:MAG: M48 family metalloprotease [Gammaproteobacteria bacterium]|nr:M48 family metalloprotease [Gammaproteobacteria bacterium]
MRSSTFKTTAFLCIVCTILSLPAFASSDNFRLRAHQTNINRNTAEDVDAEIHFGKSIAARILGQYPIVHDQRLINYVNLVGQALALNSNRSDIEFHFTVLDADFINAYSTPGGYVFVTRGAIDAMQNEAELAAVLAHEVAHISEKHIVKEFKIQGEESSATASISALLGSSSSSTKVAFSQAVDNAVNMLLSEGFKHTEEIEADQDAILLLASTGYSPQALPEFLARIKNKTNHAKNKSHKPTHPPTEKRLKALKHFARQEGLDSMQLPHGTRRFAQYVENK